MTIFKNQAGVIITLATGQDLTGATKHEFHVTFPDGTITTWATTLSDIAGSLTYTTQGDDLSQVGIYQIVAYVEWGSTAKHPGDAYLLTVRDVDYAEENARVQSVRSAINIDANELFAASVQSAIDRAENYISSLAARSGAASDDIALAKLNYAAYLAYQTYADRIVEQLPGAFDQQGVFQPIANPVAKQVVEKLRALKETADEAVEVLKNTPISSSIGETPGPADAEYYPEGLKLSNLDTSW